jgi:hypothetical protein
MNFRNIPYRILKKIEPLLEPKSKRIHGTSNPITDISEEFIEWLCYANAGMLNRGNLYCIDHAIKNLPTDNPILEIGSFCGLSTNVISFYKQKYSKHNKTITADKWIFEGAENGGNLGNSTISHEKYRGFVKQSYKNNVQLFSQNDLPLTFELFSDEFFERWGKQVRETDIFNNTIELGGNFSFVFIDGNHSYEFAKRDFMNSDRHLDKNGFILFDDSSDNSVFEVKQLCQEIIKNPDYELVIKNPNYLFKKIV